MFLADQMMYCVVVYACIRATLEAERPVELRRCALRIAKSIDELLHRLLRQINLLADRIHTSSPRCTLSRRNVAVTVV